MKPLPKELEADMRQNLNNRFDRMRTKRKDCAQCWKRRTCSLGLRICRRCFVESKVHAARYDAWWQEQAELM